MFDLDCVFGLRLCWYIVFIAGVCVLCCLFLVLSFATWIHCFRVVGTVGDLVVGDGLLVVWVCGAVGGFSGLWLVLGCWSCALLWVCAKLVGWFPVWC